MSVSIKSRKLTTAQLKRMSGKQLASRGYIRIAGFTKSDGTKVKTHVRKLNPSEKKMSDVKAAKEVAGNVIDFVPVIGDAKAFKDAGSAFSVGDRLTGVILVGAGAVGLVPIVGDIAAKPLKAIAKTFKKEVGTVGKSMHDDALDQISNTAHAWKKDKLVIHKPTRIPSSKTDPVIIARTVSRAEKKIEGFSKEINKLYRGNDVLARSGKRTQKDIKIYYAKVDARCKTYRSNA